MDLEQTNKSKFKLVIPTFKAVKKSLCVPCEYIPYYEFFYFDTYQDAEQHLNRLKENIKDKSFIIGI